ncbi:thymidylate synthase [Candidatus Nomurabacteria bacterium RIFCSPLOWO2_02_FULL_42_17]|uniref:Thymidylate synthase n=2 Tax=Candidatus Nomuraibacteriota TaxID=1752729 RepID=A0A1F6WI90_9BACT|nr:MAG: Thymidylate synthase [Parcubacteria group bacterium GW2011_GWA2_42_18]OGI81621.1 MAG: thymidylate synthase [Candidatus Nomurabacteria bacterium RIFCSPHIGHO2_02_FULL_42_24]OGI96934.1 MAG: thymidylate synthase [Candidatus Nomurabacteria bacterium RIFCSPLOWO2_02_FULL_42_17]
MRNYNTLLKEIMENGTDRKGRNGDTRGLFTKQLRFKMDKGFPATTTKKLAFRTVAAELLCFINGISDNKIFNRLGCHIWDANAKAPYWKPKAKFEGDLGRIYGVQWREWHAPDGQKIDQLKNAIEQLKKDPHGRRIIVSAWNPGELEQMALPPCHALYQFYSANGKLSLHMFQRSCDMFLGVPFNISSYALLLHIIAQIVGQTPDELILTLGDAHIYNDHFDAVKEQLAREPFPLPKLWLNPEIKSLEDLVVEKFQEPDDVYKIVKLENYQCHPAIKAKMAV